MLHALQVGTKAVFAYPELKQVADTLAGQRCTGKTVHLVFGIGGVTFHGTLDDLDFHLTLVAVELLAFPQRFPLGVVHFTAETRGFAMLVETQPRHGVGVRLQGQETIQGGPQAITVNRQDDAAQVAVVTPGQVNLGHFCLVLDTGDIFVTAQALRLLGILGSGALVVAFRHVDILAGIDIHELALNGLELFVHILTRVIHACCQQDVHTLVDQFVFILHRAQAHGGGGYHHTANHTHQEGNQQCLADAFVISSHYTSPPVRRRRRRMFA